MTMESMAGEPRKERDGRMRRAWGYVQKHQEMTRIGLIIGIGFAIPFLVAAGMATLRGSGRETAAWLLSATLILVGVPSLALWSSRRD